MTLSEATHRVIELAREVRDYYATELPKWHPDYPLLHFDEPSAPPPPSEAELRSFRQSLPGDMIYQLLLIMYLGRGDFSTDDLAGTYGDLRDTFAKAEYAASQMLDKGPLADYLSDGVEELRQHGIDVDKMPLKNVKPRKR
jgi:Protein of unknown function (DUF3775)